MYVHDSLSPFNIVNLLNSRARVNGTTLLFQAKTMYIVYYRRAWQSKQKQHLISHRDLRIAKIFYNLLSSRIQLSSSLSGSRR